MLDEYDHVVSLGGACEVAYQIRRYYHRDKAYLFDWWVTPFASLISLIQGDFSGLFDAKNMTSVQDGKSTLCSRTGILHHHDFSADPQTHLINRDRMELECELNKSKYSMLADRMRALNGNVLFVRQDDHPSKRGSYEQISELMSSIQYRMSHCNFDILMVDYIGANIPDNIAGSSGKLFFCGVETRPPGNWSGIDTSWDRAFAPFRIHGSEIR